MASAAQHPPKAADANHAWRPGLMTRADVGRYRAIERPPTRIGYRGLDVWGMGPPSSGGSTVGEALNILEGYRKLASDRVRALHLMLEASRFTFADRNAYLADPDFFDVPLAGLLSDSFAAERRALIDETHVATSPVAAGDPYDNADAYLADPDFFDVPLTGLLSDSFAAERRALIDEHHIAASPVAPGDPYDNQGSHCEAAARQRHGEPPAPVHHPPRGLGQQGQRRLLHLHDRVDRRQRDRRAGLRVPDEQRADRLQLRFARPTRTAPTATSARAAR